MASTQKLLVVCAVFAFLEVETLQASAGVKGTTPSPKTRTVSTTLNATGTTVSSEVTTEASCAANNGTCDNGTTPTPKTKSNRRDKWMHAPVEPSYYKFTTRNKTDCDCDLHNRFCDVNCCCDKDCSLEAKQVFSFCKDELNLPAPNSQYCNYRQYIYNNRTLYEEDIRHNSLFCITKTNLPAHYYHQKKKQILQPLHATVAIEESSSYQWSNARKQEETFVEKYGNFTNHTAVYGDVIVVLQNYTNPRELELSASFVTPDCVATKTVRYLQDLRTICRQPLHEHNTELFVQSFKANWTVITSLRFLNASLTSYEGCPKNICIPFTLKQCSENLHTCWNMTNTTSTTCTPKLCTNLVTRVKYTFTHNGTYGIRAADVGLTLRNVTLPASFVDQEREVKFLWTNQSEFNYSDYRSGNPGYRAGEPILFARLVTVINSTTNSTTNKTVVVKTQHLKRDGASYVDNFLVLPKNVRGVCSLSPFVYETVNFGYNMFAKCSHVQGFVRKANTTVNETCWLLQNNIFGYWSLDVDPKRSKNTTSNATFGHFGNARNDRLDDWGRFLFDELPEELLNATHGREVGGRIVCQNISTGIKYSVFYERVEHDHNRISAIYVEFVNAQRVELNVLQGNVFSDVLLSGETMFYDVTGVRNKRFVDPPSLNIKLPYDFFYPFIKMENRGVRVGSYWGSMGVVFAITFLVRV